MPMPIDPQKRATVEQRLRDGAKAPTIRDETGVSISTINRIAAQINLRRSPGRPTEEQPATSELRRKARAIRISKDPPISFRKIGHELNITEAYVRHLLSDGKRKKSA